MSQFCPTSLKLGIAKRGEPGVLGSAMVKIVVGEAEDGMLMALPSMARMIATKLNELADEADRLLDA